MPAQHKRISSPSSPQPAGFFFCSRSTQESKQCCCLPTLPGQQELVAVPLLRTAPLQPGCPKQSARPSLQAPLSSATERSRECDRRYTPSPLPCFPLFWALTHFCKRKMHCKRGRISGAGMEKHHEIRPKTRLVQLSGSQSGLWELTTNLQPRLFPAPGRCVESP